MAKKIPKSIRNLSNTELLREFRQMKSGRYHNITYKGKRWTTYLKEEIKRRKKKGLMRKSAGKPKRKRTKSIWDLW